MSGRRYIKAAVLSVALALALVVAVLFIVAALRRDEPLAVGEEWPRNVAHRGASELAPENTREAFRRAREEGAGGLELDVHLSRDGRVIVIHDVTVDRTTGGSGAVRGKTLAELRSLDAGYDFTPPGERSHPYRGRGVRVPTLGEVLREFPGMTVNLEIKEDYPGIERAVLEEIDRADARGRVLVASQEGEVISRFRELSGGEVATAASFREVVRFYALSLLRLEGLADPPYEALQVPVERSGLEIASRRFIEAAHSRGVRVDVWTIDDPNEMCRLLDLGADSVMTDRPGELSRVLESRDENALVCSARTGDAG